LTNVPNNAQIDLVALSAANTGANARVAPAKIALSIPSGGSVVVTFDANTSLYDMLSQLISQGKLDANTLSLSPELIYMRNSFSGDALRDATLATLGLAG
jgi:hypothetical protein